jgi:alpha-mannosidase
MRHDGFGNIWHIAQLKRDSRFQIRNLDKLIHYANLNGTVNAFYSTPALYVKRKRALPANTFEVRRDDMFPLVDGPHHVWSGHFSSRPALKFQLRSSSALLNTARQLELVADITSADVQAHSIRVRQNNVGSSWTDSLEAAVGLNTHHDAITGTFLCHKQELLR